VSVPTLDAEQRISWPGRWPTDRADLPDLMERLHFAVVDSHTLGLVWSTISPEGVSLDLLGRWSIMRFERLGDEVGPSRVVRRYRLPPSPVTRRARVDGRFELGIEPAGDGTSAWVRVADFPSLLLSCPPPGPTIYPAFHASVSKRYLLVLRSALAG
jgi:hypothetical protein